MKPNQTKHVLVFTENHAYFVEATGYLTGNIEAVYPILGNEQLIEDAWREFDNGTNRSGKAISSWRKDYRSRSERSSINYSGGQRSNAAGDIAGMDGQESGYSDNVGSYWDNYGYSSWEEFLEAVKDGIVRTCAARYKRQKYRRYFVDWMRSISNSSISFHILWDYIHSVTVVNMIDKD